MVIVGYDIGNWGMIDGGRAIDGYAGFVMSGRDDGTHAIAKLSMRRQRRCHGYVACHSE